MPSRRTVVFCLGTALAGGLGAGALAGASGIDPGWARPAPAKSPSPAQTPSAQGLRLSYADVSFAIAPTLDTPVAGDEVLLSVPDGWDEMVRGSYLFRDYEEPDTEDWIRVRIFPAPTNAELRPREVALDNLKELRTREGGLEGYRNLGQENRGVETSDTPFPNKPCYQLRYSFIPPKKVRRRYALERFFGDEDIIYLIAGYSWSQQRLDRLEPVVREVTGSLRKTER